jgi:hypothetical protein
MLLLTLLVLGLCIDFYLYVAKNKQPPTKP